MGSLSKKRGVRTNGRNPQVVSPDNPFIRSGIEGKMLNCFDMNDTNQRLLVILEATGTNEQGGDTFALHILNWNCNPSQSHNLALEAAYATRRTEQKEIATLINSEEGESDEVVSEE
jgi:hypothetical protein